MGCVEMIVAPEAPKVIEVRELSRFYCYSFVPEHQREAERELSYYRQLMAPYWNVELHYERETGCGGRNREAVITAVQVVQEAPSEPCEARALLLAGVPTAYAERARKRLQAALWPQRVEIEDGGVDDHNLWLVNAEGEHFSEEQLRQMALGALANALACG